MIEYLICTLIVIFSFLAFFFVLGFAVHAHIFGRNDRIITKKEDLEGRYLYDYYDKMVDGMKWLESMDKEEVVITSFDGKKMHGKFIDNKSDNCIILFHGYHSHGEFDFSAIIEHYYNRGLKILYIDQRGHGNSESKFTTFGVLEKFDALEWVKYIDSRFNGKVKIVLDGISMGSSTIMYASDLDFPSSVKCIIADSGYVSPYEVVKHSLKNKYHLPAHPLIDFVNLAFILKNKYSMKTSTLNSLKKCKLPVFFLHGTGDTTVPYQMTIANYNVVRGEKYLKIIEGAEHGVGYLDDKEECNKLLDEFLDKYLK